MLEAEL